MERKLVRQGNNALTTTLPADWLKKYSLKAGDTVEIEEQGKAIMITTRKEFGIEKADLDITGLGLLTNRTLIALYIRGCDEIRVTYKEAAAVEKLKRAIDEMVGFEIISQSRNECVIKEISRTSDEEFQNILRRTFLLVKLMGEEISESLKNSKSLEHIPSMDTNINKFANFCLRVLNKRGYSDFNRTSSIYFIIKELEHLADSYKELAVGMDNKKVPKELVAVLDSINRLYGQYIDLFFGFKKEKAVEFAQQWETVRRSSERQDSRFIGSLRGMVFCIVKMFGEQLTHDI